MSESPEKKNLISAEKQKEYNARYYKKNREQVLTKIKEKKLCTVCNKMVSMSNFSRHVKSNLCIQIVDVEKTKHTKKIKKIRELNEYIKQMNSMYDTNVQAIPEPE